jgi:RHS repeat-associated protein
VVYGPGRAVDQPLSVTRYAYRDRPGTGQPTCPSPGDTTSARCVLVQWPLLRSAYDRNRGGLVWPSWQGSLLEAKRDGSGWEYKRARVYDPQTGRFTQEDPIGLAGGLNLYGFANGDPVNFSDPFGLCPPADENYSDCAPGSSGWYAYRLATGRGSAFLNNVGGVLATCGESTACWATLGVGGLASLGVRALASRGVAAAAEGLSAEASSGALQAMERQLATAGRSSVEKTIRSLTNRIAEHELKIAEARAAGGNVASMEREIRAWRETIDAARKVLGIP